MRNPALIAALLVSVAVVCPSRATVPTTTSSVTYIGNGSSTAFTVPFKFLANSDLLVKVNSITQSLTTHYTVTGAGSLAGGTVTFVTAPVNGLSVTIARNIAYTQPASLRTSRTYDPTSLEVALDRGVMLTQQARAEQAIKDAAQDAALAVGAVGGSSTMVTATGGTSAASLADRFSEMRNVKRDFGAACNGSTDDTAAFQNAVNAATVPGEVRVPACGSAYKINGTVSVPTGVNIIGDNAVLDLTSNTGVAFSFNVGGAANFNVPPTVVSGFRVNGNTLNTGTYFVQLNRMPFFSMHDVTVFSANVAKVLGESALSKFDRVTAWQPVGTVFLFQLGTGSFGANGTVLDHVYIENAQNATAIGVQIDTGSILIAHSYLEQLAKLVWVNGGSVTLDHTSLNLRGFNNQVAIRIDGTSGDPAVTLTGGSSIAFGENISVANQSYGIQSSVDARVIVADTEFSDVSNVVAPSTIMQAISPNGVLSGSFTGSRIYANAQSSQQLFTIFDPTTVSGGIAHMTFSGNSVRGDAGAPNAQIDFTKAGATGTISNLIVSGNGLLRATNLLRLDGGRVSTNNFQGIAATITWVGGSGGSLTGNTFGSTPTVSNPVSVGGNQGYEFGNTQGARLTTGSLGAGAFANITLTWPRAWPGTAYTVNASVYESTTFGGASIVVDHVVTISATQVVVVVHNTSAGALTGTVHAVATYDPF